MARFEGDPPLRRALAAAALAAGALVGGAVAARTARRRSTPPASRTTPVLGVDEASHEIRFGPTDDALLPGRYSLWFAGGRGHARIGAVLRRERHAVVRELLAVDTGDIRAAREGRFNGWMHLDPGPLGLPWRSERVQTTQGVVPAWVVPGGDGTRWAVLVHGRSSVRQEALRAVPAFHAAGRTVLLPAYRGDGEAPDGERQRYAVADAEWVDVESAILHALDAGAEEVVLAGWSSGASIVLATAHRSRLASVVTGVVLDSPVLDRADPPRDRRRRAVPALRRRARTLLRGRRDGLVRAGRRDAEPAVRVDPGALAVPVLVLHSEDDGVASIGDARAFAEARPDLVTLVPFTGARHTRLWNLDPVRWETAVRDWLAGDEVALAALSGGGAASARRGGRSRRGAVRRARRSSASAAP